MNKVSITDKAKELVSNFYQPLGYLSCGVSHGEMWSYAKRCAVMMVNEMLEDKYDALDVFTSDGDIGLMQVSIKWWESVKKEIDNL